MKDKIDHQVFFPECSEKNSMRLPLFQENVSAGFPSPAQDYIENSLDLNEFMIQHPSSTFFVRVQGDSMRGAGIFSGDILVVDRSLEATNGKIIVAIIDGEFTVKRLVLGQQSVHLVPANAAYPVINVHPDQDFQVWGVVTYVIHKPE